MCAALLSRFAVAVMLRCSTTGTDAGPNGLPAPLRILQAGWKAAVMLKPRSSSGSRSSLYILAEPGDRWSPFYHLPENWNGCGDAAGIKAKWGSMRGLTVCPEVDEAPSTVCESCCDACAMRSVLDELVLSIEKTLLIEKTSIERTLSTVKTLWRGNFRDLV